jgi:hypothetical protein
MLIQHHDALETQTLARERKFSATEATLPLLPAPQIDGSFIGAHEKMEKHGDGCPAKKKRKGG